MEMQLHPHRKLTPPVSGKVKGRCVDLQKKKKKSGVVRREKPEKDLQSGVAICCARVFRREKIKTYS